MRTSCNGCRVLRKGCSDDCVIRPCLNWIKSPESQANATVFLAKFYGRAGLLNLLNAGPDNLRPAIFQSLLYEACGRVVDPVYGSVGLLSTGQWQNCQVAVNSVLNGIPIETIPESTPNGVLSSNNGPPHQMTPPTIQLYDIRHMASPSTPPLQTRTRHRRTPRVPVEGLDRVSVNGRGDEEEEHGNYSMFSAETISEGSNVGQVGESELGLELTLGLFNNSG